MAEVEYFNWICELIHCKGRRTRSYNKLLRYLYDVDFTYLIDLDENRAQDGLDLRERFEYETKRTLIPYLGDKQCSVLEMLVALALRCEEQIMDNAEENRLGEWFWGMIENLGLGRMSDSKFDLTHVMQSIDIFLNREYSPDGEGGLFTIEETKYDLTKIEIWYQMCWYLDSLIWRD